MNIQLNTDKNIQGHERLESYLEGLVGDKMSRFAEHLTRIEIHLSDENGPKEGPEDIKCTMEARPRKMQPIVVSSNGDTIEKAVNAALGKLSKAVATRIDKL